MKMMAMLVTAAAAGTALAGQYDQAYALFEMGDSSEVRKEAPATISKIDGKSTRNPRKSDPVSPGQHVVTVSFSSARGIFRPETVDLQVNVDPCVRYRVVAVYEAKTGPDWTPKLYPETIGECRSKFLKGK